MQFYTNLILAYCLMLFIIVSGMNYDQKIKESAEIKESMDWFHNLDQHDKDDAIQLLSQSIQHYGELNEDVKKDMEQKFGIEALQTQQLYEFVYLEKIDNAENKEQFYCEYICYKMHPFGVKTKCGHKFCISCICKIFEQEPSLCAYCRTPLSADFINDYSFVDINIKNLENIEIEDLQNCFHLLPILPDTTCADILTWLSKDNRIDVNFVFPLNEGTPLFSAAYSGNFDITKLLVEQGANITNINEDETSVLHFATKSNLEIVKYFFQLGININQNGKSGTPLLWAVQFGNIEIVDYLILNGAKVNLESLGDQKTIPLIAAAYFGHFKIVQLLLDKGAVIDYNSEGNGTPLSCAVENGHLDIVEFLIKNKADVNLGMENGLTPLMICTLQKNLGTVKMLLAENVVDVNRADLNGYTALHFAAQIGSVEIAKYLITEKKADVNVEIFELGETPLIRAVMYGNFEIVKLLLENDANVNQITKTGRTALHFAAELGDLEIVEHLIKNKVDVNLGTGTALMMATIENNFDIVKILLKNEADVNKISLNGYTALHFAVKNGSLEIAEYLIKNNADIDLGNEEHGDTPLILASMGNNFGIVKMILENDADVNKTTINGETALHFAADVGSLEIAEYLINKKADVNLGTSTTALTIATFGNSFEIVKLLLENEADINKTTETGHTALHFASQFGYLEIVKHLIKKKADVNLYASKSGTPLVHATMGGHFDVIQCLIQNNAKIDACDTDGFSVLHWAVVTQTGSLEILKYLIKNGARANLNTKIGSPLHIAASFGYLEMTKILIYHGGANVNSVREGNGFLPLHEAVEQGHFEVCKYLISHGANINKKTKNGFSAYDLAIVNSDVLLAQFLFQNLDF